MPDPNTMSPKQLQEILSQLWWSRQANNFSPAKPRATMRLPAGTSNSSLMSKLGTTPDVSDIEQVLQNAAEFDDTSMVFDRPLRIPRSMPPVEKSSGAASELLAKPLVPTATAEGVPNAMSKLARLKAFAALASRFLGEINPMVGMPIPTDEQGNPMGAPPRGKVY